MQIIDINFGVSKNNYVLLGGYICIFSENVRFCQGFALVIVFSLLLTLNVLVFIYYTRLTIIMVTNELFGTFIQCGPLCNLDSSEASPWYV